MSSNARKPKTRLPDRDGQASKIAVSMGGKRFDPDKVVGDSTFEIDDFLRWRNERRRAEVEAEKECLP